MRPFKKNHTWGNKEIKDWAFVRNNDGNIVIDETRPNWWQDKKNPERHGIRIPVLDADGNQKLDSHNRKQWKREVTDATGWNRYENNTEAFVKGATRTRKSVAKGKANNGTYEAKLKCGKNEKWYGRSYVTYTDGVSTYTLYSDITEYPHQ